VSHSLSPFIMNLAFREAGLDAAYVAFPVQPEGLAQALEGLAALGIAGANVTYPHKEGAAELVGGLTERAAAIGAVNAISYVRPGRESGAEPAQGVAADNTDAGGCVKALALFAGFEAQGKRAYIYGAGGSARAAGYGLLEAGAREVTFCVRDPGRARGKLSGILRSFPGRVSVVSAAEKDLDRRLQAAARSELLVNATPLGMSDQAPWDWKGFVDDPDVIRGDQVCFDFVYGGRGPTFAGEASLLSKRVLDGLPLLVCQARDSFKMWTGLEFDARRMMEAVRREASRRRPGPGRGQA